MEQFVWLIPALPLLGFLINGIGNKSVPRGMSGLVASVSVLGGFILSVILFTQLLTDPNLVIQQKLFTWMATSSMEVDFGFMVDRLSVIMLLVVTGVGFLIHVYSMGYMHEEPDYARYFAYLNLFVFFMLLLVLGSGYLMMFVGWEGVGLCSYLLIGFWNKNTNYNNAAKKAFIMNRIGDLGFLLGIFLIFITFGSVSYPEVFLSASQMTGLINFGRNGLMSSKLVPDSEYTGIIALLPNKLRALLLLARLDRPIGWWLLFWPCIFGLALSGGLVARWDLALWMLLGAIVMRGAGCVYNDIVDRDLDAKVARTASRPLARGAGSQKAAWAWRLLGKTNGPSPVSGQTALNTANACGVIGTR